MPSFADGIFESFSQLRARHAFVPSRASSNERFASLLRKETDDICVYVLVHDDRSGGANMDVDVWVAPPHSPDDGLDRLYVGYKIRIASEYDLDPDFFQNCESRIVSLLPCLPGLFPAIRAELKAPVFRTKRITTYLMEQRASAVVRRAAAEGSPVARDAIQAAGSAARGLASLDDVAELCTAAAINLKDSLDDGFLEYWRDDFKKVGAVLARRAYVQALCDLSAGGPAVP